MKIIYIYSLKHPITNEVRYIGKTTSPKRRYNEHIYKLNKNDHKTNWIKSLLSQGLKPIMEVVEESNENIWEEREKFWITQFDNLTNLTDGGGSYQMTDEVKKKISNSNKGKVRSEEFKKNLSEKNKGKVINEEYKKKISDSNKGKVRSEEYKKNLCTWRKTSINPKTGLKRQLGCIVNGVEFDSINEAARILNINRSSLQRRLKSEKFPTYILIK
jgi:group I intron endonuclease